MTKFFRRYRWHLLFWTIYFVGFSCLSVFVYHATVPLAAGVCLCYLVGQGPMVYLMIYRWVPLYFRTRRIGVFLGLVLLTTIVCALITA
jgi:hypothetical protein